MRNGGKEPLEKKCQCTITLKENTLRESWVMSSESVLNVMSLFRLIFHHLTDNYQKISFTNLPSGFSLMKTDFFCRTQETHIFSSPWSNHYRKESPCLYKWKQTRLKWNVNIRGNYYNNHVFKVKELKLRNLIRFVFSLSNGPDIWSRISRNVHETKRICMYSFWLLVSLSCTDTTSPLRGALDSFCILKRFH